MDWLTRKLGPLPVWGWAAAAVGGFFVVRYVKSKQATTASSGTAVPIGGSPFNFPDWAQPDSGTLLPTSSIPTSATTTTNSGGGTSANTTPLNPNLVNGTGLTNRTTGTGTPAPAPRVNYYSSIPVSAMPTTAGSGPGGQTRAHL